MDLVKVKGKYLGDCKVLVYQSFGISQFEALLDDIGTMPNEGDEIDILIDRTSMKIFHLV